MSYKRPGSGQDAARRATRRLAQRGLGRRGASRRALPHRIRRSPTRPIRWAPSRATTPGRPVAARARDGGTGRATPRPRTHPRTRPRPRHRSEMAEPKLLTVPQVAAEFQVTAQTIRNWIDHGRCRRYVSAAHSASNAKTSRRCSSVRAPTAPRSPRVATSGNQPPRRCPTATPPISRVRSGTTRPTYRRQPRSRRSRRGATPSGARAAESRPLARSSRSTATASSPATSASSS